jgi:hypothetical protein
VSIHDMPVAGSDLDAANLAAIVAQLKPDLALVEAVHAGRGWGSGQTFSFGFGCGVVRGVLGALGVPTHMVTPTAWKKHHGLAQGREGRQPRQSALLLFPKVASVFARKKDDGRAEAALIARYGAEVLTGLIPDRSKVAA